MRNLGTGTRDRCQTKPKGHFPNEMRKLRNPFDITFLGKNITKQSYHYNFFDELNTSLIIYQERNVIENVRYQMMQHMRSILKINILWQSSYHRIRLLIKLENNDIFTFPELYKVVRKEN